MRTVRAMSENMAAYYDVPFMAFINVLSAFPALTFGFQAFTRGINHPLFWAALLPVAAAVAIDAWVITMQYRAYKRLIAEGPGSQDRNAPRPVMLAPLLIILSVLTASILGAANHLAGVS